MSFNAKSYYRNKWRRTALAHLERARDIKRRRKAGNAYDWESIESAVKLARIDWSLYLLQRRICRIDGDPR